MSLHEEIAEIEKELEECERGLDICGARQDELLEKLYKKDLAMSENLELEKLEKEKAIHQERIEEIDNRIDIINLKISEEYERMDEVKEFDVILEVTNELLYKKKAYSNKLAKLRKKEEFYNKNHIPLED